MTAAATCVAPVAAIAAIAAVADTAVAAAAATAVERRGRHHGRRRRHGRHGRHGRRGRRGRRGRNSTSWNRRHLDKFDCNEIVNWGGRVDVILHMIYTPVIILIMYQKKRFVFQPKLEEFDRMFLGY